MREAPEVIYLQWSDGENYEDNTWCQDQINDDDVEYIKKATTDRWLELLRDLAEWTSDTVPNKLEERLAKELEDA